MRAKISSVLWITLVLVYMILSPISVFALDDSPALAAISFKNAVIDTPFNEEQQEYTITLNDNTTSPTLEKYGIKGDADIFINYIYNETNHQIGITATLQYDAGSRIYNFMYSNPPAVEINSNNNLRSIYALYGELSPQLNDEDTSYNLYIPSDLTQITITPVTSDTNAYCAPIELTLTPDQAPKITLTCIASDGSKKEYTLSIKRVNKTTQDIKFEMSQEDFKSFVEGTRIYEKPEFMITIGGIVAGVIIILILFAVTKRITINPMDKDEVSFYRDDK
ncbi:MAG: cadherin-like beta sandwich domain-containing protein [Clostridium sp.]|nr:cadherin-like beta sandwich domain-containing protein [Clostridium sp.]